NWPTAASVPSLVHEVLHSPGQSLDPTTRAFFESRFGHDFSHVRVHTDTKAAESARAVNALAYTVGHDIAFGSEQYAPGTRDGNPQVAHGLDQRVERAGPHIPVGMRRVGAIASFNHPPEREATAAADHIVAGNKALGSSGHAAEKLQRQEADAGGAPQKDP